jgi:ACS family glucarate transporter-like MFS transporter
MAPSEQPEAAVPAPAQRPTRARFVVLGLLCSMAFVLYLDRICMGQAVVPIEAELGLSDTRMGFVHIAFTIAYGLFEVPTGHWGDRHGARRVLTRIVLWWSAFTALTGLCWGFWSLVVVRFLFGAGEAGAFPNSARIVKRWFPAAERGRYQGFFLAASLVGGSVAPGLAGWLIDSIDWRWTFGVFGIAGVVWAAVFAWWFRDNPSTHPAVNDAERALLGPAPHADSVDVAVPWRAVAANRNIWLLGTIITLCAFNTYLYFSWYSTYLQKARGVDNLDAGWFSSLVLAGGAIGTLAGGFAGDWIGCASATRTWQRRLWSAATLAIAAVLLVVAVNCDSPLATSMFASVSLLALQCQQSVWWTCAIEISGRHVGALFGLMNGVGVFGAMASQAYVGTFADWRKGLGYTGRDQWDPLFIAFYVTLLAAAFLWLFVDATRTVGDGDSVG